MDAIKLSHLESQINGLTHTLKKKGITKAHKVAFIATTDWPTIFLFLALFRRGAIACPLSPRLPNSSVYVQRLEADFFLTPADCVTDTSFDVSYDIDKEAIATLLFTSGSSGTPKIAAHTYANHFYNALGFNEALEITEHHKWHLSLPLYHVSGISILFRCLLTDASLLLPPIPLEEATHISMVPTQVLRLKESLPGTIIVGGAPLPSLCTYKGDLKLAYGLTEMSATVTLDGESLPYRELKLAEDGEVFVRGKTLFKGYYPHTNLTEETWFATGDLGTMHNQKLKIIGRKDLLFISGGENIQPEEIEEALLKLPGMIQAIVIPKPDPEFGARPVAFIDSTLPYDLHQIQALLEPYLPRFKLPIQLYKLPAGELKPSRQLLAKSIS